MTTSGNDFDAAKAVADQLQGMEKERQHRILRWVAESLGLDLAPRSSADRQGQESRSPGGLEAEPPQDSHAGHRQQHPVNIKSFVDSKKPKSDMQFAAVVAYYYRFQASPENKKDTVNAETLQDAARLAGSRRLPKPHITLNNAKNQGYLDSPERGEFRINSVGENLVAMTLPGSEAEPARRGKVRTARRKARKPAKR